MGKPTPPPTYEELLVARGASGLRSAEATKVVKLLRDPEVRAELAAIVREAVDEALAVQRKARAGRPRRRTPPEAG
jgi:hypothetical protein